MNKTGLVFSLALLLTVTATGRSQTAGRSFFEVEGVPTYEPEYFRALLQKSTACHALAAW
jgi:hypothetical protein